jgi:hypothetical protein
MQPVVLPPFIASIVLLRLRDPLIRTTRMSASARPSAARPSAAAPQPAWRIWADAPATCNIVRRQIAGLSSVRVKPDIPSARRLQSRYEIAQRIAESGSNSQWVRLSETPFRRRPAAPARVRRREPIVATLAAVNEAPSCAMTR